MSAIGKTAIGLRKENEDCFYIGDNEQLFLIADGMGGHENGRLASRIAVQQFLHDAEKLLPDFSLQIMEKTMEHANATVHSKQEMLQGGIMGTTLTATVRKGDCIYVGHVGDSRLYLVRAGEIRQLTMDHSYFAELLRRGEIPSLDVAQSKNVLLKALGPESEVEGQFFEMNLEPDDVLLWCTDGLYNLVRDTELLQIISETAVLENTADMLMQMAESRGVRDNLTIMIYRHDGKTAETPEGGAAE